MKKILIIKTAIIILLQLNSSNIFAQAAGNEVSMFGNKKNKKKQITPNAYIYNDKIVFNINALYNVRADKYVAIFNVNQIGKTADETNKLINSRINGVIEDLKNKGIKNKQVYVDMLTFVPEYEYEIEKKIFSKTYTEVPKGFRMQKNIHISYTDSRKIDELVNICAKYEIYDLVKVNYYSKKIENIYDTLRIASIKLIQKKIENYKNLGINLDNTFKIIAEKTFVKYPNDRYSSYNAFNSSSIDVIKKRTNIKRTQKSQTYYYDPISSHNYDIVINSIISEPIIQYAFNLKFELRLEQKQKKTEKEYYIINKDGVMKKVDIK